MRRRLAIGGLIVLVLGATAVNFVLIGGALRQGREARATQCKTFPISMKLYAAARHYHLISAKDLKTYMAARPKQCPPRP